MRRLSLSPLLSTILMLVVSSCGPVPDGDANHPTAPQALLGGVAFGGPATFQANGITYRYADDNLIRSLPAAALQASGVVGAAGGGVNVLGHRVEVPRGAVSQQAVFTITTLPTGYAEVYLTAVAASPLGRSTNVGSQGFQQPVRVALTYSRSTNVPDPSTLVVVRVNGANGSPEVLPTVVDLARRTVSAELGHFSRYAIAYPD